MVYRLTKRQKIEIAHNLIDVLTVGETLSQEARIFITNWILTGPEEKTKAYYDVWDYILLNYMPQTRPVLYRSCKRRNDGKIASFTGRIYCAERFRTNNEFLIICDTNETLRFSGKQRKGEYEHTFYPISELLKKESLSPNSKLSKRFIENYHKEDEYILRVDLNLMYSCKWYGRDTTG